ncbi:hypothetical protein F2Q70_00021721 [Brassica cretica]|uniref:Uncharacterized protein n=1 Tax=Brassica cretica TaxID=69181 RepID=A0A8S9GPP6_BRACR|nr:hypothetical protein F2Q70_00021721 [Brassica cretica]
MSSSHDDKRGSDVEMGEATSQAPVPVPSVGAPACVAGFLSFREKLACRKAEKESVRADTYLPSSSALVVMVLRFRFCRTQEGKSRRAFRVY